MSKAQFGNRQCYLSHYPSPPRAPGEIAPFEERPPARQQQRNRYELFDGTEAGEFLNGIFDLLYSYTCPIVVCDKPDSHLRNSLCFRP